MNIFEKFKFILKKPKVIIVTGNSRQTAKKAIFQVLKSYFKVEKEILILESEKEKIEDFSFYLKNSKKAAVVITQGAKELTSLVKNLPLQTNLIFNFDFDNEIIREIKDMTGLNTLTFGFQEGADLRVTDVKLNHETNFKINYQGNIVPVWLEGILGKEQIYDTLAAACVGIIFNLNLIEISQALKNYYSLSEKKNH